MLMGTYFRGLESLQGEMLKSLGRTGQGQFNGHDAAPKLRGNYANLATEEIIIEVIRGGA